MADDRWKDSYDAWKLASPYDEQRPLTGADEDLQLYNRAMITNDLDAMIRIEKAYGCFGLPPELVSEVLADEADRQAGQGPDPDAAYDRMIAERDARPGDADFFRALYEDDA